MTKASPSAANRAITALARFLMFLIAKYLIPEPAATPLPYSVFVCVPHLCCQVSWRHCQCFAKLARTGAANTFSHGKVVINATNVCRITTRPGGRVGARIAAVRQRAGLG